MGVFVLSRVGVFGLVFYMDRYADIYPGFLNSVLHSAVVLMKAGTVTASRQRLQVSLKITRQSELRQTFYRRKSHLSKPLTGL